MVNADTFWLKINYFFLTNRNDFKKWWVILLIAVDVFIVVFSFTNAILYVLGAPKQNNIVFAMAENPINFESIRVRNKPISLEIVDATVLPATGEKYDLVTHVINNNTSWAVEAVDYKFIVNGVETDVFSDYIMPQSDKYLTISGVDIIGDGGQVSLAMEVVDIAWKRVASENDLLAIDFDIKNIESSNFVSTGGALIYPVKADVENKSFRSFWTTRFVVVLYSNDIIAGIDHVFFDNFLAGETRLINSQWNMIPYSVTDVVILPDMNLLDRSNLIN